MSRNIRSESFDDSFLDDFSDGEDLGKKDKRSRSSSNIKSVAKQVGKWKGVRKMVPKSKFQISKIHQAAQDGSVAVLAKKLDKKPQLINFPNENGCTPLHIALLEGHYNIISLLLKKGAQSSVVDNSGRAPIHCACACKDPKKLLQVCSLLLSSKNIDASTATNDGNNALHYFVKNAIDDSALFLEIMSKLIENGADVNAQNVRGETPLHEAAQRGLDQNVIVLLSASNKTVKVNLQNCNGETGLHMAARVGSAAVVKILLGLGADPYIIGNNGNCLEVATNNGNFLIADMISEIMVEQSNKEQQALIQENTNRMESLVFGSKLLEEVERLGHDPSVAVACLYQLQKRGEKTNDLKILIQEINKQNNSHQRECSICLCEEINSLLLPCRHSATCIDCGDMIKAKTGSCPICRKKIEEVIKIYLA